MCVFFGGGRGGNLEFIRHLIRLSVAVRTERVKSEGKRTKEGERGRGSTGDHFHSLSSP